MASKHLLFAPERTCYFGGLGNGTNTKHLKIKFESFRFSLLIIWLSLQYFENYAVPVTTYIYLACYYCKKKLHHLILLEVHDSSEQHSETSVSGLKRKEKDEKRRKQNFSPTILDLDETHNRSYNADLKQYQYSWYQSTQVISLLVVL